MPNFYWHSGNILTDNLIQLRSLVSEAGPALARGGCRQPGPTFARNAEWPEWVGLSRWLGVEGGRWSRRALNGFTGWNPDLSWILRNVWSRCVHWAWCASSV